MGAKNKKKKSCTCIGNKTESYPCIPCNYCHLLHKPKFYTGARNFWNKPANFSALVHWRVYPATCVLRPGITLGTHVHNDWLEIASSVQVCPNQANETFQVCDNSGVTLLETCPRRLFSTCQLPNLECSSPPGNSITRKSMTKIPRVRSPTNKLASNEQNWANHAVLAGVSTKQSWETLKWINLQQWLASTAVITLPPAYFQTTVAPTSLYETSCKDSPLTAIKWSPMCTVPLYKYTDTCSHEITLSCRRNTAKTYQLSKLIFMQHCQQDFELNFSFVMFVFAGCQSCLVK